MKRIMAVGVILLFSGIAVAPTINFNTVKASQEDDLIEVTSQACGIKGYKDTTVKLTREQYQNLEEYLVEFRARLNQTSTNEEAVPLFKDAVVELNKYGLLPRRMNVEKAQKLVSAEVPFTKTSNLLEKVLLLRYKNCELPDNVLNVFCLVYTHLRHSYVISPLVLIASVIDHFYYMYGLKLFLYLGNVFFDYCQFKPLMFLSEIGSISPAWDYYTIGLYGVQNGSDDFFRAYGFSGIRIFRDYGNLDAIFFGFALKTELVPSVYQEVV